MMAGKKLKWYKIADNPQSIDWQSNQMAIIEAGGKKITLIRYRDEIAACAHKCPHAGGILADGFIDAAGNIVCPLHRYKFNLQTGQNTSGEGFFLKTFAAEIREDGVFIGFLENNFLNWLK